MEPSPADERPAVADAAVPAASAPAADENVMVVHTDPAAADIDGSTQPESHQGAATPPASASKPFDPLEALKLGSLRLTNMIRRDPKQQQQQQQQQVDAPATAGDGDALPEQPQSNEMVARIRATAAGLGARAKEQSSRFYQASVRTAASTAEGIRRLAQGEPVQALCRGEVASRPCPQLVLACCTALVSGGGITTECIFKHNPPQELVDRLAATAAGPLSLLPPGASPHAVAALLKQFLLGLPEPLLTYRLLPQWVAAGDHPESCGALIQQLPAANANTLQLLLQTCSYMNEQAAQNEMDSQALAEVLAPVVAWKPPPRPQASGQGPFQGFAKALTFRQPAADAATAEGDTAAAEAAGVGGDAAATAAEAVEGVGHLPISQAGLAEAHKVTPLDDAELDAIVTVLEYMISHFSGVFGA